MKKIKKHERKLGNLIPPMNYEFYNKREFHSKLFFCAKNRTSSAVLVNSPSKSKKKCSFSDFSDWRIEIVQFQILFKIKLSDGK